MTPALDSLQGAAEQIGAYIAEQRWGGAKGSTLADVHVEGLVGLDELPAFADARPAAVAIIAATLGATPVRYQLPLVTRTAGAGEIGQAIMPAAAATGSPPADPTSGGALSDGALDPAYREALLRACASGAATGEYTTGGEATGGADAPGRGLRWAATRVHPGGALAGTDAWLDAPDALGAAARASRVGSAEQSNTSILYEGRAILKLFRRLEHGEHPDVEIGAFLAARGFAHVPALLGVLTLADPAGTSVAGMLQALVPGAEDAWAHAVRAAGDALGGRTPLDAYAPEAARLGAVTRALHDALASDPVAEHFAPEPAQASDVRRWAAGVHAAYDAMRVAAATAGTGLPDGVLDRAVALEPADAAAAEASDDAGAAIRHHGDYHLGQVLRGSGDTLFVVDFEGEPAKPLAERRRKHSALRDVAGMLRSFAYAAAFARRSAGATADGAAHDTPVQDDPAARWEQSAREAFLDAYFGPHAAAPYLPRGRAQADALVRLFEMEKLFYELRYELQNRPDWVGIPLAGLARLAPGRTTDGAR